MRYLISVVIGCTGGGFESETNHIKDVREIVREYETDKINKITVFDRKADKFIYWKDSLAYKPDTNLLQEVFK